MPPRGGNRAFAGHKAPHQVSTRTKCGRGRGNPAGVLKGDVKDVLLLDVTPLSLALRRLAACSPSSSSAIRPFPRANRKFSPRVGQPARRGNPLLQGERQFARDNKTIGKFHLTESARPARRAADRVTFDIDANGILHSAPRTWAPARNRRSPSPPAAASRRTRSRNAQGRRTARGRGPEAKEEIETRNEADNAVYRSEKMLKDNKDKISDGDRGKIESTIAESRKRSKAATPLPSKPASEKLNEAWQAVPPNSTRRPLKSPRRQRPRW